MLNLDHLGKFHNFQPRPLQVLPSRKQMKLNCQGAAKRLLAFTGFFHVVPVDSILKLSAFFGSHGNFTIFESDSDLWLHRIAPRNRPEHSELLPCSPQAVFFSASWIKFMISLFNLFKMMIVWLQTVLHLVI